MLVLRNSPTQPKQKQLQCRLSQSVLQCPSVGEPVTCAPFRHPASPDRRGEYRCPNPSSNNLYKHQLMSRKGVLEAQWYYWYHSVYLPHEADRSQTHLPHGSLPDLSHAYVQVWSKKRVMLCLRRLILAIWMEEITYCWRNSSHCRKQRKQLTYHVYSLPNLNIRAGMRGEVANLTQSWPRTRRRTISL